MEFALVAMVLLTLLIGIIQFAIYFWSYQVGAHAAREGARRYAVQPCDSAANNALVVDRIGAAAANAPGVSSSFAKGSGNTGAGPETGDSVTVTVTYSAPNIGDLISLPAITKSATARVEDVSGCTP
ncbi:TadE/TadG family type IV pilus assembly protein [Nocardioides speluncae]|uniref:TadE/TadG family type IV pilus assembly protein n=1 Tax=Nocardioides speluncae TaxID=2670337 RepID=UPI001379C408|nr:TadE/TadG family type IV pilus assembly protein [Nocardioides speluncae]